MTDSSLMKNPWEAEMTAVLQKLMYVAEINTYREMRYQITLCDDGTLRIRYARRRAFENGGGISTARKYESLDAAIAATSRTARTRERHGYVLVEGPCPVPKKRALSGRRVKRNVDLSSKIRAPETWTTNVLF